MNAVLACTSCGIDLAHLPLEERAPRGLRCASCADVEAPDPRVVYPPVYPEATLKITRSELRRWSDPE